MTAQNPAKQVIGRYWGGRAAGFDHESLHAIATDAERAAWNRIIDLLTAGRERLNVLDVGCGTGFLALLFAERGHLATGSDLAPEMIELAQRKAQASGANATFLLDDAEALSAADATYDLVISRHLFWTLPQPEQALREWIRVTCPGGRIAIVDGQWGTRQSQGAASPLRDSYGEAVVEALPNFGGAPAERVADLMRGLGLQNVQIDMLADLLAAQRARMSAEAREGASFVRYVVFGDVPA